MDETFSQPNISMENATREYLPDKYDLSPMYAGEEQLEIKVRVFKSFPGSHAYFGGQLTHPITHEAEIYKNDAKEKFIFKQDIFRCIQYRIKLANLRKKEVVSMLCYYLSSKEIMLDGFFELIPWNINDMETFAKDLKTKLDKITMPNRLPKLKSETVFKKLKEMLPSIARDPEYKEVREVLDTCSKGKSKKSEKNLRKFYHTLMNRTKSSIDVLEKLFKKHPEWISRKKTGPAIVRAFEFGTSKNRKWFVMPHELLSEMKKTNMDCTSIEKKVSKRKPLSMWILERAQRVEGAEKIKFLKIPIKRARHRAAYIPTFDGKYCIPAVDALTELLHDMISRRRLFENIGQTTLDILIEKINEAIKSFGKGVCFVSVEKVKKINESLFEKLENEIPSTSPKKKRMNEIRQGDFSTQKLNYQLRRLGILHTFPDIIERDRVSKLSLSDKVANEVNERKLPTTSDMFDMIERCQIISIAQKTEKISEFLHRQNSCELFTILCKSCRKCNKE